MIPAFTRLEDWFSTEEQTRCPSCEAKRAIEHGSVRVCLACAAVSIGAGEPIAGPSHRS